METQKQRWALLDALVEGYHNTHFQSTVVALKLVEKMANSFVPLATRETALKVVDMLRYLCLAQAQVQISHELRYNIEKSHIIKVVNVTDSAMLRLAAQQACHWIAYLQSFKRPPLPPALSLPASGAVDAIVPPTSLPTTSRRVRSGR